MCREINGYRFFDVETEIKFEKAVFLKDVTYSNERMGNRATSIVAIFF